MSPYKKWLLQDSDIIFVPKWSVYHMNVFSNRVNCFKLNGYQENIHNSTLYYYYYVC